MHSQRLSLVPLASGPAHGEVDAALIRLVDVRSIPEHLNDALTRGGTLAAQVGRHLDAEVFVGIGNWHGVGSVHAEFLQIGGDDLVGGGLDD